MFYILSFPNTVISLSLPPNANYNTNYNINMELVVTSTETCKNVSMANISNIRNIRFVSKYKLKFSLCPMFRCIHILLKHLNMDHMLTHPEIFKSRHIYSIKKKLQNHYETG
jgi:ribonuclease BN (tRNA processing enzyme)